MRITMIGMFISFCVLYASIAFGAEEKPMRPVAVCNDGKTYSNTTGGHMGACRSHGGVKSWVDGSPVRSKVKGSKYE